MQENRTFNLLYEIFSFYGNVLVIKHSHNFILPWLIFLKGSKMFYGVIPHASLSRANEQKLVECQTNYSDYPLTGQFKVFI